MFRKGMTKNKTRPILTLCSDLADVGGARFDHFCEIIPLKLWESKGKPPQVLIMSHDPLISP